MMKSEKEINKPLINLGKNVGVFLICLTLLAGFFRLYRVDDLMRFIWDEGRDMLAIRDIIVERDLTLFGPFNEIDGRKDFFGVFHYYLMLPSLWLFKMDPVGPAIFTALLGTVAVLLGYFWLRSWMDDTPARVISVLSAVSPMVVYYNRWPWNPNTTTFFSILVLLTLQAWKHKPRYAYSLLIGLTSGLLFQLHYFNMPMLLISIVVILLQPGIKKITKFLNVFYLILGFVLPNLSFVIFDITHDGFYSSIIIEAINNPKNNQGHFVLNPVESITAPVKYLFNVSKNYFASNALGLIGLVAMIYALKQSIYEILTKKKIGELEQLSLGWLFLLILIALFPNLNKDYYSSALWMGIPISIYFLLNKLFNEIKLKPFIIISLLLCLIFHLAVNNHLNRLPGWDENMPKIKKVAEVISNDAVGKQDVNIASFVDSDTRATRFRYFAIENGTTLMDYYSYPHSQHLYIITPKTWEENQNNPAWEQESFRELSASLIGSFEGWNVFRVSKP